MDRIEKVRYLHTHGCNCAQAVVLTYEDVINVDKADLYRLSEGLGRGFGGAGLTCGAISGAVLVLSYLSSDGEVEEANTRQSTYHLIEGYIKEFTELYQSSNCNDLITLRVKSAIPMKTCTDICIKAVQLIEKYIEQVNS